MGAQDIPGGSAPGMDPKGGSQGMDPVGWIPRDGSQGMHPELAGLGTLDNPRIAGFARSTGNDQFALEIPIPAQSKLKFPVFPERVRPVRVPRSPLRSVCCHSRLFMLPRDSDGIKSFQDTRTVFPLFLLHPRALWEELGEDPKGNSGMSSSGAGRGEQPKLDPGILESGVDTHPNIPI